MSNRFEVEFKELAEKRNRIGCAVHQIECEALFEAVLSTPPGDIVEVGSAWGGSTLYLAEAALLTREKRVISVDPYPEELEGTKQEIGWYQKGMCARMKQSFKENVLDKYLNVEQYNTDINGCIAKIPDGLSVVFIDGRHDGDYSRIDYEALFPKIRVGGMMIMHDMCWLDPQGNGVGRVSPRIAPPTYRDIRIVGCMKMGTKII